MSLIISSVKCHQIQLSTLATQLQFSSRVQEPHESASQFVMTLRKLFILAYGDHPHQEAMFLTRVKLGLTSPFIRCKLLEQNPITYAETLQLVERYEQIELNNQLIIASSNNSSSTAAQVSILPEIPHKKADQENFRGNQHPFVLGGAGTSQHQAADTNWQTSSQSRWNTPREFQKLSHYGKVISNFSHNPQSYTTTLTCYNCGRRGHTRNFCNFNNNNRNNRPRQNF